MSSFTHSGRVPTASSSDSSKGPCQHSLAVVIAVALLILAPLSATAQDIVSVEEHWELQIGLPDAASSAPQISMLVSPTGHLYCDYFVFTLNHQNDEGFHSGGMQVQHWHADDLEYARNGPKEGPLDQEEEVVSWVQRVSVDDGVTTFEVLSGESETWGCFGGQGYLSVSTNNGLPNLNEFRPGISIEESGVSYAGNRVVSLVLQRLRWTDSTGQVYELEAPIDVDTDLDP